MSVDKLQRVMWRLQGKKKVDHMTFKRAIMKEIGTDPRTMRVNIQALEELGWVKRLNRWYWELREENVY